MDEPIKYNKFKADLLPFCERENLKLIEAELKNDGICFWLFEDRIVLNKKFRGFKGVPA